MKKWMPTAAVAVLVATGSYRFMNRPNAANSGIAVADNSAGSNAASMLPEKIDFSQASTTTASIPATPASQMSSMQTASSAPLSASSQALPALTRSLDPPQTLTINDRIWAVLGTREVPKGKATQTVLVLRDGISGQLEYRQSALRFVLQPGNDYEAFIRERRDVQRLFVSVLYAEVAVDAASIAGEYTALSSDQRVARVEFLPLTAVAKLR